MKQAVSIYVRNIPARVHWRWLRKIFENKLYVLDVFLSKRSGVLGTRFGFVRFSSIGEANFAVRCFNGVFLLNNKLKVAMASNNGRQSFWKKVSHVNGNENTSSSQNTRNVEPAKRVSEKSNDTIPHCQAIPDPDFQESLKFCVVGKMKGYLEPERLEETFRDQGVYGLIVSKLPSDYLLIEFRDREVWNRMKEEEFLWLTWLSEFKIWSPEVSFPDRMAWLCCYGLPIECWSWLSSENLASLWGRLVKLSPNTELRTDFSRGVFMIQTSQFHRIEELATEVYNGKNVTNRVSEIEICPDLCSNGCSVPPTIASSSGKSVDDDSKLDDSRPEKEIEAPPSPEKVSKKEIVKPSTLGIEVSVPPKPPLVPSKDSNGYSLLDNVNGINEDLGVGSDDEFNCLGMLFEEDNGGSGNVHGIPNELACEKDLVSIEVGLLEKESGLKFFSLKTSVAEPSLCKGSSSEFSIMGSTSKSISKRFVPGKSNCPSRNNSRKGGKKKVADKKIPKVLRQKWIPLSLQRRGNS